jgi:MinD-like ATPase involved in chromosome partitioning or flagellar assembly
MVRDATVHFMTQQDPYHGAFQQSGPALPGQWPAFPGVTALPGPANSPHRPPPAPAAVDGRTEQHPAATTPDAHDAPPSLPDPDEILGRSLFQGAPATTGLSALDYLDIKRRQVPAKKGWRGCLYKSTGINLGPGKDESYELSLRDQIRGIVRTTFPIAVLNVKGGVGKTVVCETLGSVFADVRGDRVIAVDLDADAGNLVDRHGRQSSMSLLDLASDTSVSRYLDVRAHTSMNGSRLEVLAAPDYPRTDRRVERDDVLNTMAILRDHYSLVLMDCGTTLKSPLMEAVLREARALVVVCGASLDAMKETQLTLEWLRHNSFQHLLESTVLAINNTEPGKSTTLVAKAVDHFSREVRPERVIVVPFDQHVHDGREIFLELLSKKSRRRYLEMAAVLSHLFPRTADRD